MSEDFEASRGEKGLAARHLVLVFLAGVAVCAVFFSLGFLVGFNERFSKAALLTERVNPPAAIPPTVNPPLETAQPAAKQPTPASPNPASTAPETISLEQVTGSNAAAAPGAAQAPSTEGAPTQTAAASKSGGTVGPKGADQVAEGGEVGTGLTVQVAAVRTKEDAENLVNNLKKRGYPVFLVTPEYASPNDNLFRVQVGPFGSLEDAEKVRQKLVQGGFKPFIKR